MQPVFMPYFRYWRDSRVPFSPDLLAFNTFSVYPEIELKFRKEGLLMENKQAFAKFISEKRSAAGLTQKELAERLYVTDTTVSKWERGLSYPDISLISSICRELNITEHEFITASDDSTSRTEKKQAKRYRGFVHAYQLGLTGSYVIALVTCFICNLAVDHTLSWFFIVLASLVFAFSVTILPTLLKKYRALITFGSATILLHLLLFVCSLYTGGWYFSMGFPIANISLIIPWLILGMVYCRSLHWSLRTGIVLLYTGVFVSVCNPLFSMLTGQGDYPPIPWFFDLYNWQGDDLGNKITTWCMLAAGAVCVIVGLVLTIRRLVKAKTPSQIH